MLNRILPPEITAVIQARLNLNRLYELRFRAGLPLAVCYGGTYYYLGKSGLTSVAADAFIIGGQAVADIVVRASEYSLYAVNHRLMQGFITVRGGIRIGVCGELVFEGGEVKTVKNYTSVNIRVPHEVKGCADGIMPIFAAGAVNTLLVAPLPGLIRYGFNGQPGVIRYEYAEDTAYLSFVQDYREKGIAKGVTEALKADGVDRAEASVSAAFSGGSVDILSVRINLSNSVIDENCAHINKYERTRDLVAGYLNIDKTKVTVL